MTTLIRSRSVSIHVVAGLTLFFATGSLRAQFIYEQLQSFGLSADSGGYPMSAPIEGLDGRLYGSTPLGGIANLGSLYRADRNGLELRFIHSFAGPEGASPSARLAQDATGRLFGTTQGGGSSDQGVVYSVLPDGSGFRVLKSFDASDPAARKPYGGCILARDGFLYGTTYEGGLHGGGTVFKLGTEGQGFSVLHDFGGLPADGLQPRGELIEGTDGMLYGTTEKGGAHTNGTVFALSKSGSAYKVLRSFSTVDGIGAQAGPIQGQDGRLYGTLYSGGPQGGGVAYALETDGTAFTLIKAFAANEGYGFSASLTETSDGALYAVATFGGAQNVGGVFRFLEDGSDFRILKGFNAQAGDAYNAVAPVTAASDGKLYFTTPVGGAYAAGTLSKMSVDGTGFGILKSFSRTGTAATYGRGELTGTTDGLIFGVTQNGGEAGKGTVFRVQPNGTDYSIVHSFGLSANDSANPVAGVIQGQDGSALWHCPLRRREEPRHGLSSGQGRYGLSGAPPVCGGARRWRRTPG